MSLEQLGKLLLLFALILAVTGGLLYLFGKSFNLGRLPGDIVYKKDNFSLYFPITTAIILSVILTILLNLIFWFLRR
jgi:uncharacterized protein HemY